MNKFYINFKEEDYILLIAMIVVGLILRLRYFFDPLWIDEVLFYNWVTKEAKQAYLIIAFFRIYDVFFNIKNPIILRLPFLLTGILCIPLSYISFKNKYVKVIVASIITAFPLFVFWGAIAKIYVFAWFFFMLTWKWDFFYYLLALTTPLGLIGLNPYRKRGISVWIFVVFVIFLTVFLFILRPDSNRNFLNWRFISNAKRIWTLPILIVVFHIAQFFDWRLGKRTSKNKI